MSTPQEKLAQLQRDNPGRTFALADQGSAIGVYDREARRFVTVLSQTLLGPWAATYDLVANGKSVWTYPALKQCEACRATVEPDCFLCERCAMREAREAEEQYAEDERMGRLNTESEWERY